MTMALHYSVVESVELSSQIMIQIHSFTNSYFFVWSVCHFIIAVIMAGNNALKVNLWISGHHNH